MKSSRNANKNNSLLLVAAVIVILCLAVVFIMRRSEKANTLTDTVTASGQDRETGDAAIIEEGGSLVIPLTDVTTEVSFYPVEVAGTTMEVIAVKDSDGNIRTAFNTCQVCYGSGRGYYVQQGNVLVCQNCGNQFTVNQVGIQSGGCNPWPITGDDRTITDEAMQISYDFLAASREIFAHWKADY